MSNYHRHAAVNIPLIATAAVIALMGIIVLVLYVSASNRENALRNQFNAQQRNLHNQLDLMSKKISQTAQVSQAEVAALKDIIVGNAQARGKNGGSLATLVHEAVPNVDIKTLQNLQNLIAGARDSYATQQTALLDIKREHDNVRTMMPSSLFVGGRPELMAVIVTSTAVEQAFDTCKDDNTSVFGK